MEKIVPSPSDQTSPKRVYCEQKCAPRDFYRRMSMPSRSPVLATPTLLMVSLDARLREAIRSRCCPPCSFETVGLAEFESGASPHALTRREEPADVVLIEWDVLHAPLFGAAAHAVRSLVAPTVAICQEGNDIVAPLVLGADAHVVGVPSVDLLKALTVAYHRTRSLAAEAVRREFIVSPTRQRARSNVVEAGPLRVDRQANAVSVGTRSLVLPPRQVDLLALFTSHPEDVLSRERLLNDVWGIDFETGTNVVDVYVHRLRDVLKRLGLRDALQTVRGRGYRLSLALDG